MDNRAVHDFVGDLWDRSIISELTEYIRLPNKSVSFDPDWRAHGHMDRVAARFLAWASRQQIKGLSAEIVRLENRTPLLFIDIPGRSSDCVLLYGHMDKQPEMSGWRAGLDPWTPVREGDRLYGRGAADDGYALFAVMGAISSLQAQYVAHARCVVVIEACEESGSFDLPFYIDHLRSRIGSPSLVIALDSGCGNYDQLWCTTSLRGMVGGVLKVEVLTEGVHSGDAGGVVPCSFRIARQVLNRIENEETGELLPREFHAPIPDQRREQAEAAASALGDISARFPLVDRTRAISADPVELILNRTWRPAMAILGADGLPPAENAGNVLRPMTALKISVRLPPGCDANVARRVLKDMLEKDPPYDAKVTMELNSGANGWDSPPMAPWLTRSIEDASRAFFGKPPAYMGEGGTIPFMAMLGERFPKAQFFITGVLGPQANAHGPNEFLHIPTGKRITACVAKVLADHYESSQRA